MLFNEQIFLAMVVVAFASFGLVLGYESFAEWLSKNKQRRH